MCTQTTLSFALVNGWTGVNLVHNHSCSLHNSSWPMFDLRVGIVNTSFNVSLLQLWLRVFRKVELIQRLSGGLIQFQFVLIGREDPILDGLLNGTDSPRKCLPLAGLISKLLLKSFRLSILYVQFRFCVFQLLCQSFGSSAYRGVLLQCILYFAS